MKYFVIVHIDMAGPAPGFHLAKCGPGQDKAGVSHMTRWVEREVGGTISLSQISTLSCWDGECHLSILVPAQWPEHSCLASVLALLSLSPRLIVLQTFHQLRAHGKVTKKLPAYLCS